MSDVTQADAGSQSHGRRKLKKCMKCGKPMARGSHRCKHCAAAKALYWAWRVAVLVLVAVLVGLLITTGLSTNHAKIGTQD